MTAPTLPRLSEAQFQRQVTELAELRGWSWAHFRPAMTSKGWRTPVSGPLGAGWPDLVLVRDRRMVLAELKRDGGRLDPAQLAVLGVLKGLRPVIDVFVWHPADWPRIEDVLR